MIDLNKDEFITIKLMVNGSTGNTAKVVTIDPVTRLELIKNKHSVSGKSIEHNNKEDLIQKYKNIAESIDKLVKINKSKVSHENKVTKSKVKRASIKINREDLLYDISKIVPENKKIFSEHVNNVIIKDNNIVIDNINDEKLKINISKIIKKEIEKSTQNANLSTATVTSSAAITSNLSNSFATPAHKVIKFNDSNAQNNKRGNDEGSIDQDIDDNDNIKPKRFKSEINSTETEGKQVSFIVPSSSSSSGVANSGNKPLFATIPSMNDMSKTTNNAVSNSPPIGSGGAKPALSFGTKRSNENKEESSNLSKFSFGSTTTNTNSALPSISFAKPGEIKPETSAIEKPKFSFGTTANESTNETKPIFSFGSSSEKKSQAKPVFGSSIVEKKQEEKPAFAFESLASEKTENLKPSFGFGGVDSSDKKEEIKPLSIFGSLSKGKKDDFKPAFAFGSSSEETKDSKPKSVFGSLPTENNGIKPSFGFGGMPIGKKDDNKPTTLFSSLTAEKKEDDKPSSSFENVLSGNKSAFSFGSSGLDSKNNKSDSPEKNNETKSSAALDKPTVSRFDPSPPVSNQTATKVTSRFDPSPLNSQPVSRFESTASKSVFGQSSEQPSSVKPAGATGFNFGSNVSAAETKNEGTAKSVFGLGSASSSVAPASTTQQGFSFGSKPSLISNASPKLAFGKPPPGTNTGSSFNFGQSAAVGNGTAPGTSAVPFNLGASGSLNSNNNTGNASSFNNSQFGNTLAQPNPNLHKPVTGFNFGNSSTVGGSQLNFNLSNKFKSPTPPVGPMGATMPQQNTFNPNSNLNFSFSSNASTNVSVPFANSVSPPMQNPQASPNMMFGGFNQSNQQSNVHAGGAAPVGRRIAKLRRR
ncbi:hypothetical protein QEN19_004233 [Hanseniaspora menglaensis]